MRPLRPYLLLLALLGTACAQASEPRPLPEFTTAAKAHWFNSPPLQVSQLRGKVVLIDDWTYDCWNCYRSFPWLRGLEAATGEWSLVCIGWNLKRLHALQGV